MGIQTEVHVGPGQNPEDMFSCDSVHVTKCCTIKFESHSVFSSDKKVTLINISLVYYENVSLYPMNRC